MKEFEGKSAAFDNLGAVVVRHDRKLTQYKVENKELAHIPAEEMQKVEEADLQQGQMIMISLLVSLNVFQLNLSKIILLFD